MKPLVLWLLVSNNTSLSAKKHGRQNRFFGYRLFPTPLFYVYVKLWTNSDHPSGGRITMTFWSETHPCLINFSHGSQYTQQLILIDDPQEDQWSGDDTGFPWWGSMRVDRDVCLCSAPWVWGFVHCFNVTAHARSRSTTHSSLSSTSDPRQFHIWSTSVPRPGKPSGDPAAASLIIS